MGSFIPGRDVSTGTCYYGCLYEIVIFGLHEKKSSQESGIALAWRQDPALSETVFIHVTPKKDDFCIYSR